MSRPSPTGASARDNSWRAHLRATLVIGLPMVGVHLAQMGIGFVDTVMLGRLGAETLAASVLATTLFFLVMVVGYGIAQAVMPLTSQAVGKGADREVRRAVRMGFWAAFAYGLLMMPLLWNTERLLLATGQDPALSAAAQDYVRIMQWSIFPVLLAAVLRGYLASIERVQIVMWVTLAAIGVNGFLNYVLIFGHFGAPAMGLRGAALASLGTNLLAAGTVVGLSLRYEEVRRHSLFARFWRADWAAFFEVLRLGVPISLTILAEVALFSAASFMMGWLGTVPLAAHGIALQITSISFMIPMSFSQTGTVRIGQAVGRGDALAVTRAARVVYAIGLGFALLAATLFWTLPAPLISLYLDKGKADAAEILAYAVPLLGVAGAFQVVDTLQSLGVGMLRGLKDTRVPMMIALFSYWGIGVPAAYFLGIRSGFGGVGVWSGLAAGLSVAAVLLNWRFVRRGRLGLLPA